MIRHKQKLSGVRIGPVSILVFVIALSISVLATLAITTARANEASTERQIAFTADTYANEVAGQTVMHTHVHIIPRYTTSDSIKIEFKENKFNQEETLKRIKG